MAQHSFPGNLTTYISFPAWVSGLSRAGSAGLPTTCLRAAALAVARMVSDADLAQGRMFPDLSRIRDVSVEIGVAISELAFEQGLARIDRPEDIRGYIESQMFAANYERSVSDAI